MQGAETPGASLELAAKSISLRHTGTRVVQLELDSSQRSVTRKAMFSLHTVSGSAGLIEKLMPKAIFNSHLKIIINKTPWATFRGAGE